MKPILGNGSSRYVTGEDGLIYSNFSGEWKALRSRLDKYGYPQVTICWEGRQETRTVHSLVCEAWHGPRPEWATGGVRHYPDPSKTNNRPENLSWSTVEEQDADQDEQGTRRTKESHGMAKLTWEIVRSIRAEYGPPTGRGVKVPGRPKQGDLAKKYGVSQVNVSDIISHRIWKEGT